MNVILFFLILAGISICGVIQWWKDVENNWGTNWKNIRYSIISFIASMVFGTMLFFMFNKNIDNLLSIKQNISFLFFWILFILSFVQLFYQYIMQNITKIADSFINKQGN